MHKCQVKTTLCTIKHCSTFVVMRTRIAHGIYDGASGRRDQEMSRTVYRDFDEFAESIAGVEGRFVPTARSAAEWWLQGGTVKRISCQQLQIGGRATFAGGGQHDMLTLGLPMTDARCIRIDACELKEDGFIVMDRAQPFAFSGSGVTRWCGIALPLDHPNLDVRTLEALGAADSVRARTRLVHLTELRRLVSRMLSPDSAIELDHPSAAAALEQDIALAVASLLECSHPDQERRVIGRPHLSRRRTISRCLELIESSPGSPVLIEDLCRVAGMCERTLRSVFQEYFGVPPMRLLRAKQLWDVRAALLSSSPEDGTVKGIAARFGVWDLSLFAHNYKELFAELPSVTLRARMREAPHKPGFTWLKFAAQAARRE